MREFVPVQYIYEEDAEDIHVNPNVIAYTKTTKTVGDNFSKEFPWTVTTTLTNLEEVDYYFKTREEARLFVRKVGAVV